MNWSKKDQLQNQQQLMASNFMPDASLNHSQNAPSLVSSGATAFEPFPQHDDLVIRQAHVVRLVLRHDIGD
jgi:hypothetical protein